MPLDLDPHALLLQHFDERLVSGFVLEASTDDVWLRISYSPLGECWQGTVEYVDPYGRRKRWSSGSRSPLILARVLLDLVAAHDNGTLNHDYPFTANLRSQAVANALRVHLGLKDPQ
jgi:hypothetical protein